VVAWQLLTQKGGFQSKVFTSMKKRIIALTLSTCSSLQLYGIDSLPWFSEVYSSRTSIGFNYYYFNKISGSLKDCSYPSNNYLSFIGTGFTPNQDWDVDFDLELVRTPRQNYSFRSSAIQGRYRLLNDINADPISLVVGVNIRGVGSKSVKDVSSPYASYCNFEGTLSLGKEYAYNDSWIVRWSALGALGVANQGYPWCRCEALVEGNCDYNYRLGVYSLGYFGLRGRDYVDVHHFTGWGKVLHQSVDVGAFFRYKFERWGGLKLAYTFRVYALNYPEWQQSATLVYDLPFSMF